MELIAGEIGGVFTAIAYLLSHSFTAQPQGDLMIIVGDHIGDGSTKTTTTQHGDSVTFVFSKIAPR